MSPLSKRSLHLSFILFGSSVLFSLARMSQTRRFLGLPFRRSTQSDKTDEDDDIGDFIFNGIRKKSRSLLSWSFSSHSLDFSSNATKSESWREKQSLPNARKDLKDTDCEIHLINDSDEIVVLCWVDDKGKLRHGRPVNDKSIKDGSVSNKHREYTQIYDSFVCIRQTEKLPKTLADVDSKDFIFSYTPKRALSQHAIVLTKSPARKFPRLRFFSRRSKEELEPTFGVKLSCEIYKEEDKQVISSVDKVYDTKVCCGFTLRYEPGVFECTPGLAETLEMDLKQVMKLLPSAACRGLQKSTQLWINKSITYGTVANPQLGTSCTFHPVGGKLWLQNNGLTVEKEGCVEMFCADNYLKTRDHWGIGGLLLHEYSHAYHSHHCPGRFDCDEIKEAFNVAMSRKLYDLVPVHGPQGSLHNIKQISIWMGDAAEKSGNKELDNTTEMMRKCAKAYACANCMEFFAELSVAYHWTKDQTNEYNKWFPFNRAQLEKHDPGTYRKISKMNVNTNLFFYFF